MRLNKSQFSDLALHMQKQGKRLNQKALQIAFEVLVIGRSGAAIAKDYSVSKQRVSDIKKRLSIAYFEMKGYPSDWEVITIAVPKIAAERIKYYHKKELQKLSK